MPTSWRVAAGIPTINAFFGRESAEEVQRHHGRASVITAANVFAHIEDIHEIVDSLLSLLADDGMFISESHYLISLLETLQYDTVYHEHLRYYSLSSLNHLLEMHGLEVIHAKRIPTHGGSIRVYAARKGVRPVSDAVSVLLRREQATLTPERFAQFRGQVSASKLDLLALLHGLRRDGSRLYAIGAPSRASTLVNYVGLDESIVECVLEIGGRTRSANTCPARSIPVLEEKKLFAEPPDYALLLSWHIGDELAAKLRQLRLPRKVRLSAANAAHLVSRRR